MSVYEQALQSLAGTASKVILCNSDDYIKDGLLYCGNCHTPKQARVYFLDAIQTPYCMCQCEIERRSKAEAAAQQEALTQRITLLRYEAFPDCKGCCGQTADKKQWTFANDNQSHPKQAAIAQKYAEHFETFRQRGEGLLFYGTVGTGKSYLAACIANALIDRGNSVLMTNFARIRNEAQGAYQKQEYFDKLNRYDLLILDDLAAESNTEYMQEIVFGVMESRCNAGLPLIVTTNLTAEELKNPESVSDRRRFSRLLKVCCPVLVDGEDQRKKQAVERFAEMMTILNG